MLSFEKIRNSKSARTASKRLNGMIKRALWASGSHAYDRHEICELFLIEMLEDGLYLVGNRSNFRCFFAGGAGLVQLTSIVI